MEKKKLPLISVIVPIYNIEEYLQKCIESIINQTYTNIQIILIDDGSTDTSGNICDMYAKQDSRIEVLHKKNGGLVSARKEGVLIAKGEYVSFVDGDDWVEVDALERLMESGQDADIITCACCEEYGDYQIVKKNSIKEGVYRSEKSVLYQEMLMNKNFFEFGILPHLCDKVIRRRILLPNQMQVNDLISYGEDAACSYPCILDADSICITNIPAYHYRQRAGSIVKSNGGITKETLKIYYDILKNKFDSITCSKEILQEQLYYFMWFILLVKSYGCLNDNREVLIPFVKVKSQMKVVIYGAGGFGKVVKEYCDGSQKLDVVGWVDLHYEFYQNQGLDVVSIQQISELEFDCVIIAILNEKLAENIKDDLVEKGIDERKIDWVKKDVLATMQLPDWMVYS